jgi:hypothetical protein
MIFCCYFEVLTKFYSGQEVDSPVESEVLGDLDVSTAAYRDSSAGKAILVSCNNQGMLSKKPPPYQNLANFVYF